MEDNLIRRDDKVVSALNPALIARQKIGDLAIKKIKKLHLDLQDLFEKMKKMSSITKIRRQPAVIEKIEFAMQKAWKFPVDRNFHTWWILAPHCSCPRMDNRDWYGVNRRIINLSCVLHGTMKPTKYTKVKNKDGTYSFEIK